ncbi:protein BTG3-like [Discoglossus pictus]
MHHEIEAAVNFIVKVLSLKKSLKPAQLETLGENLVELLTKKYKGHWYPDKPERGQAYRCIRINPWQYVDDLLLQACVRSNIEYTKLALPEEMTVWIDPYEVCGRFGEHTDYFTVAKFTKEVITEKVHMHPERVTSDYSSEGPSSESVSENSSDDETTAKTSNRGQINFATTYESVSSSENSDTDSPDSKIVNDLKDLHIDTDAQQPIDVEDNCISEVPSKQNMEASIPLTNSIPNSLNDSEADCVRELTFSE